MKINRSFYPFSRYHRPAGIILQSADSPMRLHLLEGENPLVIQMTSLSCLLSLSKSDVMAPNWMEPTGSLSVPNQGPLQRSIEYLHTSDKTR